MNKIVDPEGNLEIRSNILNNLMNYIRKYKKGGGKNYSVAPPFSFDSGSVYSDYRRHFTEKYKEKNKNADLPPIFKFAFDYIQEISEHYRIFLSFHDVRTEEETEILLKETKSIARETVDDVAKEAAAVAAKEATKKVLKLSKNVLKLSANAKEYAEAAYRDASNASQRAVSKEIGNLTAKMSESSITILGIFAGIVLTVVAGLFYSSSVLDNINSSNFCRLISISALVGFVCYSLIALMFMYIERIKYGKDDSLRFNKLSIGISCVLLAIMVIFGGLQYVDSNSTNSTVQSESVVDVDITTTKDKTQTKLDKNTEQKNSDLDKNISTLEEETNIQTKNTAN